MGIVTCDVAFADQLPTLGQICAKIESICTLPVVIIESSTDELQDIDATIAFECDQDCKLQLSAYRPGAIDRFCNDEFSEDPQFGEVMKRVMKSAGEAHEQRSIHLRSYVGLEPALMCTTALALEALGGTPCKPIGDEERAEYGRPITESELMRRYELQRKDNRSMSWLFILLLPVLIPLWIVTMIWFILTLPFGLMRANRLVKSIRNGESIGM